MSNYDRFQQKRMECERLAEQQRRALQELYGLLREEDRPALAELGTQQREWLEAFQDADFLPLELGAVAAEVKSRKAALQLPEKQLCNMLQSRYGGRRESQLNPNQWEDWKCHLGDLLHRLGGQVDGSDG